MKLLPVETGQLTEPAATEPEPAAAEAGRTREEEADGACGYGPMCSS